MITNFVIPAHVGIQSSLTIGFPPARERHTR
jgi:hypothetical protein